MPHSMTSIKNTRLFYHQYFKIERVLFVNSHSEERVSRSTELSAGDVAMAESGVDVTCTHPILDCGTVNSR